MWISIAFIRQPRNTSREKSLKGILPWRICHRLMLRFVTTWLWTQPLFHKDLQAGQRFNISVFIVKNFKSKTFSEDKLVVLLRVSGQWGIILKDFLPKLSIVIKFSRLVFPPSSFPVLGECPERPTFSIRPFPGRREFASQVSSVIQPVQKIIIGSLLYPAAASEGHGDASLPLGLPTRFSIYGAQDNLFGLQCHQ